MPEKFPTTLVVGLVVAVAIGVGAYLWFGTGTVPDDSLQITGSDNIPDDSLTTTVKEVNTAVIISRLNRLRNIELKTEIFDSETFLGLKDYSITISEQPIGRENPFISSTYLQQGSPVSLNLNTINQQPLNISNDEQDESVLDESKASDNATSTNEEDTDNELSTSTANESAETGTSTDSN